MVLVKILKRRDAASLVVAILVAMAVSQFLSMVTNQPAMELANLGAGSDPALSFGGQGWRYNYLWPVVALVLQLLVLEVLARIVLAVRGNASSKR